MAEVLPEEKITRYIKDSGQVAGERARHNAFMPKNGKTSVFRISHPDLTEEKIWEIGEQEVLIPFRKATNQKDKTMKGRADFDASIVYEQALYFDPNGAPHHPRHANIMGWSNEKHEQLIKAARLAEKSTFQKKP